jgi:hypothetical protein
MHSGSAHLGIHEWAIHWKRMEKNMWELGTWTSTLDHTLQFEQFNWRRSHARDRSGSLRQSTCVWTHIWTYTNLHIYIISTNTVPTHIKKIQLLYLVDKETGQQETTKGHSHKLKHFTLTKTTLGKNHRMWEFKSTHRKWTRCHSELRLIVFMPLQNW